MMPKKYDRQKASLGTLFLAMLFLFSKALAGAWNPYGPQNLNEPIGHVANFEAGTEVYLNGKKASPRDPIFYHDSVQVRGAGPATLEFKNEAIVKINPSDKKESQFIVDKSLFKKDEGFWGMIKDSLSVIYRGLEPLKETKPNPDNQQNETIGVRG